MPLLVALALAAAGPAAPPCTASRLSLTLDGRDGDFNGMSHGGAMAVIRNLGRTPCTLPAVPRLTFEDARGRTLRIVRRAPDGATTERSRRPLRLAPGGAASTPLRWVSGEVYAASRCLVPARAALTLGRATVRTKAGARICGPAGGPATFDQPALVPGTSPG